MVLCRVRFMPPRKPRVTYASVCLLLNGGCYRRTRWAADWCPGCRRLRNDRDAKRTKGL